MATRYFGAVQISPHERGVGKELSLALFQRSVLTKKVVAGTLTGFCFIFRTRISSQLDLVGKVAGQKLSQRRLETPGDLDDAGKSQYP